MASRAARCRPTARASRRRASTRGRGSRTSHSNVKDASLQTLLGSEGLTPGHRRFLRDLVASLLAEKPAQARFVHDEFHASDHRLSQVPGAAAPRDPPPLHLLHSPFERLGRRERDIGPHRHCVSDREILALTEQFVTRRTPGGLW